MLFLFYYIHKYFWNQPEYSRDLYMYTFEYLHFFLGISLVSGQIPQDQVHKDHRNLGHHPDQASVR